jgi:hypothetical protein
MIKIEFIKPTKIEPSGTMEKNSAGTLMATFNNTDLQIDYPWEYPLLFSIYNKVSGDKTWNSELYPGSWSHFYEPCNSYAQITDKNQNVIIEWEWDTFLHGDDAHILFMLWCLNNKGAKGISIGTHDGSTGEWVEPLRKGLIEAFLVEASVPQYKKLVDNFKNINGAYPILSLITEDGRDCEFFEGPEGFTNSVIREHTSDYTSQMTSSFKKSRSLNDLICEVGLAESLDWLHLDVEGIDADLVLSLDPSRIKLPDLIIYESLNLKDEKKQEVYDWLSNNGYLFKEAGWNTIAHKKSAN